MKAARKIQKLQQSVKRKHFINKKCFEINASINICLYNESLVPALFQGAIVHL